MTTSDNFFLSTSDTCLRDRLVNELWYNPSKAKKLALIQKEHSRCSLLAYEKTIIFLKAQMNGFDHEEIWLEFQEKGLGAAFAQTRAIYKEKQQQQVSTVKQVLLYNQLATFLKKEFYHYIGYTPDAPVSDAAFFVLQAQGEIKLANQMGLGRSDVAGNLVFHSLDRLQIEEIKVIVEHMKERGFINTLKEIEQLTKRRKY